MKKRGDDDAIGGAGTASSPPAANVDSRLRVPGRGTLRVDDATVMPTLTSRNTDSPTLMIAEKAAGMAREDRRAGRVP